MTNHLRLRAAVCLLSCLWGVPLAAQTVEHPLDPLSFQEYWTVLETLKDAGRLDDGTRFSIVNLWVREASSPRTESEGMLHMSMEKPAIRPSTCLAEGTMAGRWGRIFQWQSQTFLDSIHGRPIVCSFMTEGQTQREVRNQTRFIQRMMRVIRKPEANCVVPTTARC